MCTGECLPYGSSCLLACGFDNPIHLGAHAVWTASCPGAPPGTQVGQGTCEVAPIPPTSVCCPLNAGGCSATIANDTQQLQAAVLNCATFETITGIVIGTCTASSCVPAH